MLTSMTGFGNASVAHEGIQVHIEIKSVNHRFLDINCKLPAAYSALEPKILEVVRQHARRGRVEVAVQRKSELPRVSAVRLNRPLLRTILRQLQSLTSEGVSSGTIDVMAAELLSRREVVDFAVEEETLEDEGDAVLAALKKAAQGFSGMREQEGKELYKELQRLLSDFEEQLAHIREAAGDVSKQLQQRLRERLSTLLETQELDEQRLHQEIAYLADKADITEELARIESHLGQFRETINGGEGGRKLEFLLQELGREVNTCGSKSQDIRISRAVVESKAVLERVREQVANVE